MDLWNLFHVIITLLGTWEFMNVRGIENDEDHENVIESAIEEKCFGDLGCFNLEYPWVSIERPFATLPDHPDVIGTKFYLSTRNHRGGKRKLLTTEPTISLHQVDFDPRRWTVIITHGFRSNAIDSWVRNLEGTLLNVSDLNVVSCDWHKGSDGVNYIRAAVNTRVVGAQISRFIRHILDRRLATKDRIHLIGQSLGAHVMSYVGASIKSIARLTALDPAQPGFEGAHPDTRVDPTDAQFIDVIHTNAERFMPMFGLGMMEPIGHVDFFVNGGQEQPGCYVHKGLFSGVSSVLTESLSILMNYLGCSHNRANVYYIESLQPNCSFWARKWYAPWDAKPCSPASCQQMGRSTMTYPARGTFHVATNHEAPYCIKEPISDYVMKKYQYETLRQVSQPELFPAI